MLVLTVFISRTDWGRGRYDQVSSMTHNSDITGRALDYSLALGPGKVLEARVFSNKYLLATREFLRQYASYFSPQFLTGEGFIEPQRYNLIEHGVTYWSLLIVISSFLLLQICQPRSRQELLSIFRSGRLKYFLIVVWCFFLSPLPAALTLEEVPNIHRSLGMVFGWALFFGLTSTYLLKEFLKYRWGKILASFLTLFFVGEIIYFWHTYMTLNYESNFAYRDDAKKVAVDWLLAHSEEYDQIFIPNQGNLMLHYLFYGHNFDQKTIESCNSSFTQGHISNIYLANNPCEQAIGAKVAAPDRSIVIITQDDDCPGAELITSLLRKNLTNAYYIFEASGTATLAE